MLRCLGQNNFALSRNLLFSTKAQAYNAFQKGRCTLMKKEMKAAIDEAWSHPTPEQKLFQELYFPNGKPTVEEFIQTVADLARQKRAF